MRALLLASAVAAAATLSLASAMPAQSPRLTRQRVIAEAVSSYGDTGSFFVVASTVSPYTVRGYYLTRDAADSAAARTGDRASGPYRGLSHRDPWEVLSITVRVRTDSGERELHYDPRTVDAVFLSMSAVRKFLVPYYTRVYGREVGALIEPMVLVPRPPTPPCHRMSVPCTSDSLLALPVRRGH